MRLTVAIPRIGTYVLEVITVYVPCLARKGARLSKEKVKPRMRRRWGHGISLADFETVGFKTNEIWN